jgi:hypothetical protein
MNPSMSGTITASRKPVNNALNHAWRDTAVHMITSVSWSYLANQTEIKDIVNDFTYYKLNALRQLDPSSGTYLNEVSRTDLVHNSYY